MGSCWSYLRVQSSEAWDLCNKYSDVNPDRAGVTALLDMMDVMAGCVVRWVSVSLLSRAYAHSLSEKTGVL